MDSSGFKVSLNGRQTIVEFTCDNAETLFLRGDEFNTCDLRPHGNKECDCVDVIHATSFRLKKISTIIRNPAFGDCEVTELFVACKPTDCVIECGLVHYSGQVRPFHNGWRFVSKIDLGRGIVKICLNLYKDRKSKIAAPKLLSISDKLSELLIDGTYSDVTVKSNDGATIKAHRGILAKRCEVFRAALEHNETRAQITSHFNEETLRQIMTYIYTDKTPELEDFTADLFMAAEFYQLSDLKNFCVAAFYRQLRVENAIATLELAQQRSLTDLFTSTLDYVQKNFDSIKKSEDWINLKSDVLLKMICEECLARRHQSLGDVNFEMDRQHKRGEFRRAFKGK